MNKDSKKAIALLLEQLKTAHQFLEQTMSDVTPEALHKAPGGTAHPIGAVYAHLVISEDMIMQGMLQGKAPLSSSSGDKVGVSMPHPSMGDSNWSENYKNWANNVKVDLAVLNDFAKKVYAASENYIASLTDSDLEKEMDLSSMGMEKSNVGWVISNFAVGHVNSIMGEIAALKGTMGLKGYPF